MRRTNLYCLLFSLLLIAYASSGNSNNGETPTLPHAPEIELKPGNDLYGLVTDKTGNGIEGVVVSDGLTSVVTNNKGEYQMKRSTTADFVAYSTPSEYKIEVSQINYPSFYEKIDQDKKLFRQDFKLEKMVAVETSFRLICIGDPQTTKQAEIDRFKNETMADIKKTVEQSSVPCYGLGMGDIVSDTPNLLSAMRLALSMAPIPVFQTIGNHDKAGGTASSPRNEDQYKAVFGPLNYSFNRGKVHFVSMDNIKYLTKDKYIAGFSDEQVEWLKQDLSHVSKDNMVILYYHIPLRGSDIANRVQVLDLLKDYAEVHLMCGHTHYMENYIHATHNNIYEHIHAAACGAWWYSTINGDGAPIGYGVYDIDGAKVVNSYYKSSLGDKDYQIRLHRGDDICGGQYETFKYTYGAQVVVANVWGADTKYWTVSLYEDGVKTKNMALQPSSANDQWGAGYHIGVVGRSHIGGRRSNYLTPCKHLYTATPNNPAAQIKVVATDQWGNSYEQSTFTTNYDEAQPPQ